MTIIIAMAETANHAMNEPRVYLETASWWFDRAGLALIAGTLVVLISTVLIVWLGIEKEHHWDLARDKANREIAELTKQSEQLRKDTAEANARQKEAELRLAELREKVATPRQLNEAVFSEEIKGIAHTPVEITLRTTDDPASNWLAFSLMGALEKAGWPVIQSGTTHQLFGQTPEPIKACAGNFGGIRVLSKRTR